MSATLTPELLAKLRKLNQEATHRDWEKWHGLNVRNVEGDAICSCGMQRGTRNDGGNAENEANAALIAASRNALPQLLAYIEKVEQSERDCDSACNTIVSAVCAERDMWEQQVKGTKAHANLRRAVKAERELAEVPMVVRVLCRVVKNIAKRAGFQMLFPGVGA